MMRLGRQHSQEPLKPDGGVGAGVWIVIRRRARIFKPHPHEGTLLYEKSL
jgi:hypothetical protein